MAIKDLGFPKREGLSNMQWLKLVLTLLNIIIRVLQAIAAFNVETYWLFSKPYYSLLYSQFIATHVLSMYLLIY